MTAAASSIRRLPLVLAVLVASCGPDNAGIRRLPLEPEAVPVSLTISPSATVLPYIGAQKRLTAASTPDGSDAGYSYTWTSANPGVATVAGNGTVTAVTEGEAKIIVRIVNLVDTATITVKRLPATVNLDPDTVLFTEFGATAVTDELLRVENPTHDFPQKIEYVRVSADSVTASVDGGAGDTEPAFRLVSGRCEESGGG